MSEYIKISVEDGVLTIAMDRPAKKNAIDRAMYAAMAEALDGAAGDDSIRAMLIKGVPGCFTSGNDIKDFMAFAMGEARMGEVGRFLAALAGAGKPLVAAVDGLAIGIGTTLLMHCDLVFATPGSTFRTPFLDLGLVPEAGSSLIAPRLMGHQRAFALLALGETFDGQTAKAANLVYELVAADQLDGRARDAAATLAVKPPEAMRIARGLMRGDRTEILERIRIESDHFSERLQSDEARRAFMAFTTRSAK